MNQLKMFRKEKNPFGRIIPPFFFESSESGRVFNYLHDSNSIFRAGRINSEIFSGRAVGIKDVKNDIVQNTCLPGEPFCRESTAVTFMCDPALDLRQYSKARVGQFFRKSKAGISPKEVIVKVV